jgi:GNAT superfamily N-acetyltransferase
VSITLRRATRDDVKTILALVRELAIYEREPDAAVATEEDYLRDGFGDHPRFHVILAEEDGSAIGFAFYFFTYSTWRGKPVLYLEDLFVLPQARGKGAGRLLLSALAKEAVEKKCGRFQWQVLDWNVDAIRFYERIGGRVLREWLTVRVEGEGILAIANRS